MGTLSFFFSFVGRPRERLHFGGWQPAGTAAGEEECAAVDAVESFGVRPGLVAQLEGFAAFGAGDIPNVGGVLVPLAASLGDSLPAGVQPWGWFGEHVPNVETKLSSLSMASEMLL